MVRRAAGSIHIRKGLYNSSQCVLPFVQMDECDDVEQLKKTTVKLQARILATKNRISNIMSKQRYTKEKRGEGLTGRELAKHLAAKDDEGRASMELSNLEYLLGKCVRRTRTVSTQGAADKQMLLSSLRYPGVAWCDLCDEFGYKQTILEKTDAGLYRFVCEKCSSNFVDNITGKNDNNPALKAALAKALAPK